MPNPYLCITDDERDILLSTLGFESMDDLFRIIPRALLDVKFDDMPPALREYGLLRETRRLAEKCGGAHDSLCFMGGGAYEHFIPSVVPALAGRSEYLTSYTPYQPEISQGNLQTFFEYQTLVCRLFEMDMANASMYDGAGALAEAVIMISGARPAKNRCLVSDAIHPCWQEVLGTYLSRLDIEIVTIPVAEGLTCVSRIGDMIDDRTACVVMQNPNFFGCLEDMQGASGVTHERGAQFIAAVDPISLALLAPPGEYGADAAVAEGQCLGLPPYFGGETLGIFTCRSEYMRKMPGRLVGLTKDSEGRRAFVLTLQTREQHIRREKATSNICTNHALNATRAAIYLSVMGPEGLREAAEACRDNAFWARSLISSIPGLAPAFDAPFFKEFVVRCKDRDVPSLLKSLMREGIFIGPDLGRFRPEWKDLFLITTTEVRTRDEIERMAEALKKAMGKEGGA